MPIKHKAKKSLGQNFLADPHVRERIVSTCNLTCEDTVIEIGPGQGALTRLIAPSVKRLIAVERDRDLIVPLNKEFKDFNNVEIVEADFLTWVLPKGLNNIKIIGNIPYYISTPIIERIIQWRSHVSAAWLTVQYEFAKRVVAASNNKEYGSLTCFVQYYTIPKLLFTIKSGSFNPRPKVDSALMHLQLKKELIPVVKDEHKLFNLIQRLFTQRRKTMLNALSQLVPKEQAASILKVCQIASQQRPETLELNDFIRIYKEFTNGKADLLS